MISYYFTYNTTSELICFLISMFCLAKDADLVWKLLRPYLFTICITEFYGIYLKSHHLANQWPYNILLAFQIAFTSLMFSNLFRKYVSKSGLVLTFGLVLLFFLYIYEISYHSFFRFNVVTYNSMSVLFVLYCLYYFYLLLKDSRYIDLKYSSNFWFVIGVLFFYFGSTAVNLFRGKLSILFLSKKHFLTYYIYIILNVILYSCWSYSFICRRWLTRKSQIL